MFGSLSCKTMTLITTFTFTSTFAFQFQEFQPNITTSSDKTFTSTMNFTFTFWISYTYWQIMKNCSKSIARTPTVYDITLQVMEYYSKSVAPWCPSSCSCTFYHFARVQGPAPPSYTGEIQKKQMKPLNFQTLWNQNSFLLYVGGWFWKGMNFSY